MRIITSSWQSGDADLTPEHVELIEAAVRENVLEKGWRRSVGRDKHGQTIGEVRVDTYRCPLGVTRYAVLTETPEGSELADTTDEAEAVRCYEEECRGVSPEGLWTDSDLEGEEVTIAPYRWRLEISEDDGASWEVKESGSGQLTAGETLESVAEDLLTAESPSEADNEAIALAWAAGTPSIAQHGQVDRVRVVLTDDSPGEGERHQTSREIARCTRDFSEAEIAAEQESYQRAVALMEAEHQRRWADREAAWEAECSAREAEELREQERREREWAEDLSARTAQAL